MNVHLIAKFLPELASITALVFCSFFGAYITAVLFVLSSQHGTMSAWGSLRERVLLLLPRDYVKVCDKPPLAVIRGSLRGVNQQDLLVFVGWLSQMTRIEKELEILRNRARFAAVSAIVAVASAVVVSGPVLFGLPSLAERIHNFAAIVPATCLLGFQLFFSARHAATWTEITDAVKEAEKQLSGLTLQ